MLTLVTGPPGAGKSFYVVRSIARALEAGKAVATNVELADDFAERIAAANAIRRLFPGRRAAVAQSVRDRVLQTESIEELFRVRAPGRKEGRLQVILDEAHSWMNARSWSDSDRREIVRYMTRHRHYGADVFLITQDAEMIDKQVRTLFEYHVHLRNVKRFKLAGIPVVPFNMFVAIWTWHAAGGPIVRREVYRLNWAKDLYDTHQYAAIDGGDQEGLIWLPRPRLDPETADPENAEGPSAEDARPSDPRPDKADGESTEAA